MKRYLSLLSGVVLLLILLFAESTVIEAAQIIEVSGDNAIIDSTYSFAPRFIPGVSWAEIYGCTDYSSTDELYRNSSANSGRLPQHSHVAKLTNDAVVRSGTIGVRYYKVGVYEETAVDLKIMLVGVKYAAHLQINIQTVISLALPSWTTISISISSPIIPVTCNGSLRSINMERTRR